jgi:hypothetical protein
MDDLPSITLGGDELMEAVEDALGESSWKSALLNPLLMLL